MFFDPPPLVMCYWMVPCTYKTARKYTRYRSWQQSNISFDCVLEFTVKIISQERLSNFHTININQQLKLLSKYKPKKRGWNWQGLGGIRRALSQTTVTDTFDWWVINFKWEFWQLYISLLNSLWSNSTCSPPPAIKKFLTYLRSCHTVFCQYHLRLRADHLCYEINLKAKKWDHYQPLWCSLCKSENSDQNCVEFAYMSLKRKLS